jgi:hypothetical protein
MAHRASVNQQVQLGPEATPGTSVPAGKLIEAFNWAWGIKSSIKLFRPTGRKYSSTAEELTEMTEGKISGDMDYNAAMYVLNSVYGKVTPVLVAPSTTVYKSVFTPPLSGAANPQTYTLQQGDSVRADQMAYLLFTGWGYKIDRKSVVSVSGEFMGQLITDPATMTPTPTVVPLLPMPGKQANVYLDTTSAGIGVTQLVNFLSFDFTASGYYGALWFLNRANVSYSGHVDLPPKNEVKLLLEADAVGMSLLAHMQAGDTVYVRVDALGQVIDAPNSLNAEFKHDMALKVSNVSEFSDKDGLYAIEWTLEVVEDSAWGTGTAQIVTLTNTLSAL